MATTDQWFLSAEEPRQPGIGGRPMPGGQSRLDRGERGLPLVHGAAYFARLCEVLATLGPGDRMWFLGWRGDADQRLAGPGTELGSLLTQATRRGVDVRGLLWRSHPDQEGYAEQENAHLGNVVNEAGGEVLPDERVRRLGSHHQKLVVIRRREGTGENIAFIGGIDLCHGRGDDERHEGDPQSAVLDRRYGPQPAWHDVQLEVRGPAIGDLEETFRERWMDPTPLDHQNPWRARIRRLAGQSRRRARCRRCCPIRPRPGGRPCRCCGPIRRNARRSRSPRGASGVSPAPTRRRWPGPDR